MVLSKELTQMEKPNKRQAASLEERAGMWVARQEALCARSYKSTNGAGRVRAGEMRDW